MSQTNSVTSYSNKVLLKHRHVHLFVLLMAVFAQECWNYDIVTEVRLWLLEEK